MALTKLRGTAQISAGTIDDSLISASAAIQTTKLQDSLKFIFADGSRSFTAPVSGVTPTAAAHLYWNGMLLESGAGNDYTISGNTITMLFAVQAGEKLRCSYFK